MAKCIYLMYLIAADGNYPTISPDNIILHQKENLKTFCEVMPAEGGVSNYAFPIPWPGRRDHCNIKVSMVAVLTVRTILKMTVTSWQWQWRWRKLWWRWHPGVGFDNSDDRWFGHRGLGHWGVRLVHLNFKVQNVLFLRTLPFKRSGEQKV